MKNEEKDMTTEQIVKLDRWKTITIGNISQERFTPTIKERGMNVSDWSVDMMKQDAFTVVSQEEQIDLVVVSVRDLGFDKATRYDAICARAKT